MPDRPEQHALTNRAVRRRWLSLAVLLAGSISISLAFISGPRAEALAAEAQGTGRDYSTFKHAEPAHKRLPCLLCHRRSDNSARPRRSGHTPCSGCHSDQFAASSGPLCTICHTKTEPGNVQVKPFPALKSFNVRFDHARHRAASCDTCHRPARGGAALSIPAGLDAHTTCYKCHEPRAQAAGRDISSCGTCHAPGRHTRTPVLTKAFRVSFSHAKHGERQGLGCNDCHNVRAGMPQMRQVSSPAPTQHFGSRRGQSCQTCHNNERAFGGDDFSDCKRCHQGQTFSFR
jgi:c(7)-type cytochrome triheme protein